MLRFLRAGELAPATVPSEAKIEPTSFHFLSSPLAETIRRAVSTGKRQREKEDEEVEGNTHGVVEGPTVLHSGPDTES